VPRISICPMKLTWILCTTPPHFLLRFLELKTFPIEVLLKKKVSAIEIPNFVPKNKHIEADESVTQEAVVQQKKEKEQWKDGELEAAVEEMRNLAQNAASMFPEEFEKDVDENHHIDFITAASNIRADQYGIETADRLKTKKIAGKIIPAMATSTAAVSGLVSIEMIKVLTGEKNITTYKNAWMNLALPMVMLSEPAKCSKTEIKEGVEISLWTKKWEVRKGNIALGQFLNHFKSEFGLKVTAVCYGTQVIYSDIFPDHKSRIPHKMGTFIQEKDKEFVDLTCLFEKLSDGKEVKGPEVRFYFTK